MNIYCPQQSITASSGTTLKSATSLWKPTSTHYHRAVCCVSLFGLNREHRTWMKYIIFFGLAIHQGMKRKNTSFLVHMITAQLCIPYVLWDMQLWRYCLNCIHSTHAGVCYLHHSLNPSSLINPNKSQPQAAVSADTIPPALPRSTKAQETVTHTQEPSTGKVRGWWRGGKEEWDWTGKQEMEGRREGILWEGSQSNYRQRCSPGFFGDT